MAIIKTHQATLEFFEEEVIKIYIDSAINRLSSVENEIYCIKKFNNISSKHCLEVISTLKNSYTMKRYSFSLGSTKRINKESIRRLLFTVPLIGVINQLDSIYKILQQCKINHRDINPGNLLFSEEEKVIKLSDFYWAKTNNLKVGNPIGLNSAYSTNDSQAFELIKKQIKEVDNEIRNELIQPKHVLQDLGKVYYDGSSKHIGKTYSILDIPYFGKVPFHKNTSSEFLEILKNISISPKTVLDIGCASGYTPFNLMRTFNLDKIIGYEADPLMFKFLSSIKKIFNLNEFVVNNKIIETTKFEQTDLVICTNVHMWLYKQMGNDVDAIIAALIEKSKEMFFQTAGADAAGMYLINKFKTKEDIIYYLKCLGAKNIKLINTTKQHDGGKRHLFKIKK